MIPFYVMSGLLVASVCFNGWVVSLFLKHLRTENKALQATAFTALLNPMAASLTYQGMVDESDEREPGTVLSEMAEKNHVGLIGM